MTQITLQEAFDKAYLGVMTQGGPDQDAGGACMYRTPEGLSCGVGHLLPDDETRMLWDRKCIAMSDLVDKPDHLRSQAPFLEKAGLMHLGVEFLYALQNAHDEAQYQERVHKASFLDDFHKRMVEVAQISGLTLPERPNATPAA